MLRNYARGEQAASILLLGLGLALIFSRRFPVPFLPASALIAGLIAIQLLQGAAKPYLGWVGIALSGIWGFLGPVVFAGVAASLSDPSSSASQLVALFAIWLPAAIGIILVGISMNQAGYFPARSGTGLAIVPVLGLIFGFFEMVGVAFAVIGVLTFRSRKATRTIPTDGDAD